MMGRSEDPDENGNQDEKRKRMSELLTASANISMLFTDLPYLDRIAAARAAGFRWVETWWPFADAVPNEDMVSRFLDALRASEVGLSGLNFYAGDMPGGERGVASRPDRQEDLDKNIEQVVRIAEATGCRAFNLLYGQLDPAWSDAEQHKTARAAIQRAAEAVGELGGVVLLEPLAAGLNGSYPLHTGDDVIAVIDSVNAPQNVRLLFDAFHLGANGVDLLQTATRLGPRVGHIQVADYPGRHEPGSGDLPIVESIRRLVESGYCGFVAGEYKPSRATTETLGWLGWELLTMSGAAGSGATD